MAKPPAGSSLLFGALADSGQIKQRKNGSYRMVLTGIDDINWFTDRPDRVTGTWSTPKLHREWNSLFEGVAPNAQLSYKLLGNNEACSLGDRGLTTFEMKKPKMTSTGMSFDVIGLDNKVSKAFKKLARNETSLLEVSLFIDDASIDDTPSLASLQSSLKSLQGKADNTWSVLCNYLEAEDWSMYCSVCLGPDESCG